jgi:2-hydroxy-3-keto-5-methylthiopentenyl-1-phosphate phosphatase
MHRVSAPTASWRISCDFDGTITRSDVVQGVLIRFADPRWLEAEAEWEAGRIGSRACLDVQTRLLRVSDTELADWVDQQPVDPHVADFFADCAELGLDIRVLSDGYDWVIHRVMARLGLEHVPVVANHLVYAGDGRWTVEFPHARKSCPSGTCKCSALPDTAPRAHIGDGRSDICVSDVCDLVFAKSSLLASRTARGLASVPFDTFADIRAALPGLIHGDAHLASNARREAASPAA